MPTYITLVNWTDQGVRNYQDTVQRSDQVAEMLQRLGARFVSLYWTVGPYDIVGIVEAPDDETATAALLQIGGTGNVRTTTLRAFDRDEIARIVDRARG